MEALQLAKENIWEGDLLGREQEADLLIAYIESVSQQPNFREDAKAFTIAVDAGYGEGKTYFLKRLAQQLAVNHPVAFVDAWRDDLADEPLTALAATLKKALDPYIQKQPEIREKFQTVLEKTGDVARIVAKGLAKRGLGLLITNEAVNAAGEVIEGSSEAIKDAVNAGLRDGSHEIVDAVAADLEKTTPRRMMERRIADFEAGQRAIDELKTSLSELVTSLDNANTHAPIGIIIDELDRCRPTYAVKLLEEVKHLFDIAGIVFVFGIHTGQLAHSVNAAYGSGFDGRAYLSRFIHRRYRLASPSLAPFIRHLMEHFRVPNEKLWFPYIDARNHLTTSDKIAFYFRRYGLGARDAIALVENLQTCCALTKDVQFLMPLLLPMLISRLKGSSSLRLLECKNKNESLVFNLDSSPITNVEKIDWYSLLVRSHEFMILSDSEQNEKVKTTPNDHVIQLFSLFKNDAIRVRMPLANPSCYGDLLEAVGRFQASSVSTAE